MSKRISRKIGLILSLGMFLGSVVGIGIFLKSDTIFALNNGNGVGTLVSWVLAGVISLAAAINFSEISFLRSNRAFGLVGWTKQVVGRKFRYFTIYNYSFFYFGILLVVFGFLSSQAFFNVLAIFLNVEIGSFSILLQIIVGIGFIAGFVFINFFSLRASGVLQTVLNIIKWVPLITFVVIGIALSNQNFNQDATTLVGENAFYNGTVFNIENMISSLPLALFAFDSFTNIGVFRNRMKTRATNNVPRLMVLGIALVFILYLAIIFTTLIHGVGFISSLAVGSTSLNNGLVEQTIASANQILAGQILSIVIMLGIFGVLNSITAASLITFKQASRTNTFWGTVTTKKWWGESGSAVFMLVFTIIFWYLVYGIPSVILNTNEIFDGIMTLPTFAFYGIYGIIIANYTFNRKKLNNIRMNSFMFYLAAIISILGSIFVIGYQFGYQLFVVTILNPNNSANWGTIFGSSENLINLQEAAIIIGVSLLIFLLFPLVDLNLSRWTEKINPLDEGVSKDYSKNNFFEKGYKNPILEH